jgi:RNA recognition motif-containing protein
MAKKLFVGNLSWNTRDESLNDAFARFGEVSEAKVIVDRQTGRSRGFGFVTFANDQAADDAMAGLDGTELDGRAIRVNVAQERRNESGDDDRSRW